MLLIWLQYPVDLLRSTYEYPNDSNNQTDYITAKWSWSNWWQKPNDKIVISDHCNDHCNDLWKSAILLFCLFNNKILIIFRAKQVNDGVHHAAKLFPNAYLVRKRFI